jgi:hypothetical protein
MTLVRFENRNELFLINEKDKIFEGAYLPDIKYATKNEINEFKEKYGVEIKAGLKEDDIEKMLVEKGYSEDEAEEIIDDFLDNINCLPQVCPSSYCEDIIDKKDIKSLEEKNVLFYNEFDRFFYASLLDGTIDFEEYYCYWDGRNHKCERIINKYDIKVEEIEDLYENENTYSYDYYKIKDENNETIIFRIFNSFYQGELPFVDENWRQHIKNFEEILDNLVEDEE